jgi:hypothetical protein
VDRDIMHLANALARMAESRALASASNPGLACAGCVAEGIGDRDLRMRYCRELRQAGHCPLLVTERVILAALQIAVGHLNTPI